MESRARATRPRHRPDPSRSREGCAAGRSWSRRRVCLPQQSDLPWRRPATARCAPIGADADDHRDPDAGSVPRLPPSRRQPERSRSRVIASDKAVRTTHGAVQESHRSANHIPRSAGDLAREQIIGSVAEPVGRRAHLRVPRHRPGQWWGPRCPPTGSICPASARSSTWAAVECRCRPCVLRSLRAAGVARRADGDQRGRTDHRLPSAETATEFGAARPEPSGGADPVHGPFRMRRLPHTAAGITGRYITLILFAKAPYYGTDFGLSNEPPTSRRWGR